MSIKDVWWPELMWSSFKVTSCRSNKAFIVLCLMLKCVCVCVRVRAWVCGGVRSGNKRLLYNSAERKTTMWENEISDLLLTYCESWSSHTCAPLTHTNTHTAVCNHGAHTHGANATPCHCSTRPNIITNTQTIENMNQSQPESTQSTTAALMLRTWDNGERCLVTWSWDCFVQTKRLCVETAANINCIANYHSTPTGEVLSWHENHHLVTVSSAVKLG